jgi:hypothetical protein
MRMLGERIAKCFEDYQLYRRLIVLFVCLLVGYTTMESFRFATMEPAYTGMEVAAIITTIQLPVTAMTSFVSKLYFESRRVPK